MPTKTLSQPALAVIEGYAGVPYFNNSRRELRFGLRALIGKGSPDEIAHEALLYSLREKVDLKSLSPEIRRRFLADHNLGIDCSGFAYYVLDAESLARGKGGMRKNLTFPDGGAVSRLLRFLRGRSVENAGVNVFAHENNSKELSLIDAAPGDIVVMLRGLPTNHMMIITEVASEDDVPREIKYAHSIAWPADGRYGHGVREGKIVIKNINQGLLDQIWLESGKTGPENHTYHKASLVEHLSLRRLNWF